MLGHRSELAGGPAFWVGVSSVVRRSWEDLRAVHVEKFGQSETSMPHSSSNWSTSSS